MIDLLRQALTYRSGSCSWLLTGELLGVLSWSTHVSLPFGLGFLTTWWLELKGGTFRDRELTKPKPYFPLHPSRGSTALSLPPCSTGRGSYKGPPHFKRKGSRPHLLVEKCQCLLLIIDCIIWAKVMWATSGPMHKYPRATHYFLPCSGNWAMQWQLHPCWRWQWHKSQGGPSNPCQPL